MSAHAVRRSPRATRCGEAIPGPHAAAENRRILDDAATICVNLIGTDDAEKTTLVEALLPILQTKLRAAVITADGPGEPSLRRLATLGIPAATAREVRQGIEQLDLSRLDLLLLANGGSLAMQAATDLGEHARVAVVSVAGVRSLMTTHPLLFRGVSLILLTTRASCPGEVPELHAVLQLLSRACPAAEVICVNPSRRLGVDRFAGWLLGYVRAQRRPPRERTSAFAPAFVPA